MSGLKYLLVSASHPASQQSSCYPLAPSPSSLELGSVVPGFCFLTASESSLLQIAGVPSPALASPHDALSLCLLSSLLGWSSLSRQSVVHWVPLWASDQQGPGHFLVHSAVAGGGAMRQTARALRAARCWETLLFADAGGLADTTMEMVGWRH